jgi:hypothetical protein
MGVLGALAGFLIVTNMIEAVQGRSYSAIRVGLGILVLVIVVLVGRALARKLGAGGVK